MKVVHVIVAFGLAAGGHEGQQAKRPQKSSLSAFFSVGWSLVGNVEPSRGTSTLLRDSSLCFLLRGLVLGRIFGDQQRHQQHREEMQDVHAVIKLPVQFARSLEGEHRKRQPVVVERHKGEECSHSSIHCAAQRIEPRGFRLVASHELASRASTAVSL